MEKRALTSWIRLGLAFLAFTAIITQLINSIETGRNIANFFSFFTIESNILAAVLLLLMGLAGFNKIQKKNIDFLRGAATLYMSMTGIIYILLLAHNNEVLQTTLPWVNMVLHYIMPLAVLLDWLLVPPRSSISYKKALLWSLFPLAYVIYSLVRGPFVNWYPYPFMNPLINSWPHVLVTCVLIGLGVLLLIKILVMRPRPK